MNPLKKFLKSCSEFVYDKFHKNSGAMLLATGIIGTAMSSLAQTGVIITSKKYSPTEKAFMVPQELTECALAIGVIFAITKPTQRLANKAVKTGKITSKELIDYMKKNKLEEKRGKLDFNLSESIKEIIAKIEKSDKFISSSKENKNILLKEHKKALQEYDVFSDAASAYATTAATAFSIAAVIPVCRNKVASIYQKKRANHWEEQAKIYRNNYINRDLKI